MEMVPFSSFIYRLRTACSLAEFVATQAGSYQCVTNFDVERGSPPGRPEMTWQPSPIAGQDEREPPQRFAIDHTLSARAGRPDASHFFDAWRHERLSMPQCSNASGTLAFEDVLD